MNSSQLSNLTFKRIYTFAEKCGFKIQNVEGGIAFYYYPDTKINNYVWRWRNRKELLLGCNKFCIHSLFSLLISRYEYFKRYNIKNSEPISEPISETTLNFINVCRVLNRCNSVEELTIKMDLIGV